MDAPDGTTFDMRNHKLGFRILKDGVDAVTALKSFVETTITRTDETPDDIPAYLPAAVIERKDKALGFLYSASEDVPYGALEELLSAFTISSALTGHPVVKILTATEGNLLILAAGEDGTPSMTEEELIANNPTKLVRDWGEPSVMIVQHEENARAFVTHAVIHENEGWRTLGEWMDENKKVRHTIGGERTLFGGMPD